MVGGNGGIDKPVLLHLVSEARYDTHGIVMEILNEGTRAFDSRETIEYYLHDHFLPGSYEFLTLHDRARNGMDRDRHVYVSIKGPARDTPLKWLPDES